MLLSSRLNWSNFLSTPLKVLLFICLKSGLNAFRFCHTCSIGLPHSLFFQLSLTRYEGFMTGPDIKESKGSINIATCKSNIQVH